MQPALVESSYVNTGYLNENFNFGDHLLSAVFLDSNQSINGFLCPCDEWPVGCSLWMLHVYQPLSKLVFALRDRRREIPMPKHGFAGQINQHGDQQREGG
jgi:hypothetical protein